MRQATLGQNQYHAAIFKFEKRVSNGWGGRVNYTYSRLKDNQFGEGNFFSRNATETQNAYDLDAGVRDRAARRAAQDRDVADLRAAVRRGQAVGAERRRRRDPRRLDRVLDRRASRAASRFRRTCRRRTTGIFTRMQRVKRGTGDPETDGARDERLQPGLWLAPGGFVRPAAFTPGHAAANLDDVRTPHRNNWDFVASKDIRFGGSVRGQIKLEVLNITNTVEGARSRITRGQRSTSASISAQSGFMRLTQLMFRLTF